MKRKIIEIDDNLCTGCELCVNACHEGAIGMVDGKARLLRDDYCDGLGDCLPACPTGAIRFIEREAAEYDEAATLEHLVRIGRSAADVASAAVAADGTRPSFIASWPIEIKLVPIQAPYYDGVDLLVAADCTAFAYGDFHKDFMQGKVTIIGCPKLDGVDYAEKLGAIFEANNIASVTVARMEVPCCGGLENAARRALEASGKDLPFNVITIGCDGSLKEN